MKVYDTFLTPTELEAFEDGVFTQEQRTDLASREDASMDTLFDFELWKTSRQEPAEEIIEIEDINVPAEDSNRDPPSFGYLYPLTSNQSPFLPFFSFKNFTTRGLKMVNIMVYVAAPGKGYVASMLSFLRKKTVNRKSRVTRNMLFDINFTNSDCKPIEEVHKLSCLCIPPLCCTSCALPHTKETAKECTLFEYIDMIFLFYFIASVVNNSNHFLISTTSTKQPTHHLFSRLSSSLHLGDHNSEEDNLETLCIHYFFCCFLIPACITGPHPDTYACPIYFKAINQGKKGDQRKVIPPRPKNEFSIQSMYFSLSMADRNAKRQN
ncbi:hypothetical protein VP01_849g2 [Puccinia sorghi]|uniref:Uncharacterized protein n=1 Tax=Puccinia sorghi TaxID=27349 RepID=A0A0L6U972_9BASI|nr:hypothetical protein VP01_849g2 [Puccinia sorghi]